MHFKDFLCKYLSNIFARIVLENTSCKFTSSNYIIHSNYVFLCLACISLIFLYKTGDFKTSLKITGQGKYTYFLISINY